MKTFLFVISILICTTSLAQEAKEFSFENGIPSTFEHVGGKLQTSNLRHGDGNYSLHWQCKPVDKIVYKGEIGYHPAKLIENVIIHEREHPQYETPVGLSFSIYNGKPIDTKLKLSFGRKGETDCFTYVLLNFVGWRHVGLLYERGHFIGEPHPDMDECTIEVQGDERANVFIDDLKFATQEYQPLHYFYPQSYLPTLRLHPERQSYGAWPVTDSHFNRPWLPLNKPTAEEIAAFNTIENRFYTINFGIGESVERLSEKEMETIRSEFDKIGVTEKDGIINGPLYFYDRATCTKNNKLMKKMGILYHKTQDTKQQQELVDKIVLLYKHGKQVNITIDWYDGRGFVDGLFLVKDELKQRGLLDEAIAFTRSRYDFNRMYDENRTFGYESTGENSDVIHTNLLAEMMTVLMMEDGPEKVRDMRHYSSFVSNVAFNYSPGLRDCMKPDGSHFHHVNAANIGYGNHTPGTMGLITRLMSRTTFRISQEAHERLKFHSRIRYFVSTPMYFPNSFSHKTFPNNRKVETEAYMQLAYAGTPDGQQEIDTEMAALYASAENSSRLSDDAKNLLRRFPEKAPFASGHHTMTYYAKGFHRRNDWLAALGSHSQYVYAMERWRGKYDNVHSQFVNWGTLEVIFPDTLNATGPNNGFKSKGWDYTRFPGATTIKAPIEEYKIHILNVGDDGDEHLFSDQAFVGGLDFSDGNGLFVSPIHGHYKYGLESFYATKSYFFFDDLIVCLGTNIKNFIPEYETQTTLFQNNLINAADPVFVNGGKAITSFPYFAETKSKKNNWLIDNRQVGYYIPSGQSVNIQKIRQVADYGEKAAGNFATAWINHGKAPENASYQYAMKIKTSAKEMADFSKQMTGKEPLYEVLQADKHAHILKYNPTKTTAFILYDKNYELNIGKLKGVTHSSLVMLKDEGEKINLAVSDPDMRFYEGYAPDINRDFSRSEIPSYSHFWYGNKSIPSKVRVLLNGNWTLKNTVKGNAKIIQQANNVTIVEFVCSEGFTNEVELSVK